MGWSLRGGTHKEHPRAGKVWAEQAGEDHEALEVVLGK